METVTRFSNILKDLRRRAVELSLVASSLDGLLADEAIRVSRKDDVSRLRALHASVSQQLEEEKRSEDTSRHGHAKGTLAISLTGLAVRGIVRLASRDERVRTSSDHVLSNLGGEEPPFGTVLISIDPGGLPDDVGVVSVSRLARESKRNESEIINELKKRGHLLTTENSFSLLIDRLINDVEEGHLRLPVSTEKLSKLKGSPCSKPEAGKPAWVVHYWL